jgi:NTP pyrophosphatase (non-canonical NTP hydrolase)
MTLTFHELALQNASRMERWHLGSDTWTGADWSNAMCGEAGEAANVVKKLRRHETHIDNTAAGTPYNTPPIGELLDALGDEIADVILYAHLLAYHYGINVEDSVRDKFNRVSQEQGFPERL